MAVPGLDLSSVDVLPSAAAMVIDKPPGVTSHDVVAQVRDELGRRFGAVKVGHGGTLDPFATGVLVVLIGRATRVQQFIQTMPKRYTVTAMLGWTSDTGDSDGNLTHTGNVPISLTVPTGEFMQQVPAFSAVRVAGERLYERARRGETFVPPTRKAVVYSADLIDAPDGQRADRATFDIACAGGTYIRSLIADLNDAYCEQLRRTAVGHLSVAGSRSNAILSVSDLLAHLPELDLDPALRPSIVNGRPCRLADSLLPAMPTGTMVRMCGNGEVWAVGRSDGESVWPKILLADPT